MEIQHAPKYRPQMGMAMRIMDHGSGSGLAMAMKVKMASTAQRQPASMVRPFIRPSRLRATSSSGSRNATPKTRMILMTKEKYEEYCRYPAASVGMNPTRIDTAWGRMSTPRATPAANRSRPATPKAHVYLFSLRVMPGPT